MSKGNIVRIVIWGAVAIAAAVVFYIHNTTATANKLVAEADALIAEGDAKQNELGMEGEQLLNGDVPAEFFVEAAERKTAGKNKSAAGPAKPERVLDRAKLEKAVERAAEILGTVAEKYRAAAGKFDAAAKAGKGEVVSKHFQLMAQAYISRVSAETLRREAVSLLTDKSIASEQRQKKQSSLRDKASAAENEFERLQTEAQKVKDENKGKFK